MFFFTASNLAIALPKKLIKKSTFLRCFKKLKVHKFLFGQKFVFSFSKVGVVNTTINRTNGCTLWFVMKTNTFGTFISNNVKNVHFFSFVFGIGICSLAI